MSEENNTNVENEVVVEDAGQAIDMIQETLEDLLDTADVSKVYGDPIAHEETLIIPAAEVVAVAGFGAGYGSGGPAEDVGGEGGGGGGGGKTFSRPVAIVIADKEGVRVEPVMDPTKIAMTFFTALGFMVATISRMTKSR